MDGQTDGRLFHLKVLKLILKTVNTNNYIFLEPALMALPSTHTSIEVKLSSSIVRSGVVHLLVLIYRKGT